MLRYLQEQPDVAQRVAAWREQREALRAAFAPVAAEPIPPRLSLERLIQQRLDPQWIALAGRGGVLLAFGLAAPAGGSCMAASRPQSALTLLAQHAVSNHVVYTADKRRPTELGARSVTTWPAGCRTG